MLFMASGKIVKDYSILVKYFEILENMGIDRSISIPTSNDIDFLVKVVRQSRINLLEAMSMLVARFIPRINREAARRAIECVMGRNIDEQIAVDIVARDLAGWTLEIAEAMNLIRIDSSMIRE